MIIVLFMSILQVKNITKYLSGIKILDNVSFEVKAGEVYGFLWPNWAWKTTTMKCIMSLIIPEEGNIKVLWQDWLNIKAKKEVWFMPENTYLYKYLKWREFLRFNWKFFWLSWDKLEKKIDELLKKVWLEDAWDKYLYEYSKWMLQRIWLAQSIINNPKLLFLDEPMSWLDPIWRKQVKDLMVDLKNEGTTIFFNTHILADVESICDKFSIIHHWKMIVESMKVSDLDKPLEEFFIQKVSDTTN